MLKDKKCTTAQSICQMKSFFHSTWNSKTIGYTNSLLKIHFWRVIWSYRFQYTSTSPTAERRTNLQKQLSSNPIRFVTKTIELVRNTELNYIYNCRAEHVSIVLSGGLSSKEIASFRLDTIHIFLVFTVLHQFYNTS